MYGLCTKRQRNPGYPDMPKIRNPNGPSLKAGKERARLERAEDATRQEVGLREVAAIEHTKLAESAMERTPEAIDRTLRPLIVEKPTTCLSSNEEIEDPDEECTEAMDIDKSGLDDESPIESFSDGLVGPGSDFDEDLESSENVRGCKLPVRIALTGYVMAGSTQRCCADCVLPMGDYCCCCTSAQSLLAPCSCSHTYCSQCSDPYC
jgi:hypothetical protein